MTELLVPLWLVATVFFIVALAYASVGLGGGSSYAALMVVFGFGAATIPNLSLLLNLIVATVGSYNYIRHGHLRLRLLWPFVVLSLPMAWLGGALQVSETLFRILLTLSLMIVLLRIYAWRETSLRLRFNRVQYLALALVSGALLGLLAGIVGIGGGIFLVPLILVFGLGDMKQAAASGVVFVWLNSLVGLVSRSQYNFVDFSLYLPLIAAVMAGGAIGSFLGSAKIEARVMEKILGVVIAIAVLLLGRSLFVD